MKMLSQTTPKDSVTPLLPTNSAGPKQTTITSKKLLFFSLFLTACLALSLALLHSAPPRATLNQYVHLLSTKSSAGQEYACNLNKLTHPVVILISSDGFRFGYQYKTATPNIDRLINEGTEAERGLIPVFPSATFPNHYSIATGLYPPYHGIIYNRFFDPLTNKTFTQSNYDSDLWLGEPLWVTVANQGHNASSYFWPGSQVHKGAWNCPPLFCPPKYDPNVTLEDRVDAILSYFEMPSDEIPWFIDLYFDEPDAQGHQYGPDDYNVTEAVARVDSMIGRLTKGLEDRGVFQDVHIILLGDHGMVSVCEKKVVFLKDLRLPKKHRIQGSWVEISGPMLGIRPPAGTNLTDLVDRMNLALENVDNGKSLTLYLRQNLPTRLHYSDSVRTPPIIGLLQEGYRVFWDKSQIKNRECGGSHGYDNALFSMRTIFIGHGPRFARGRKVPSFMNVEVYNIVTSILGIQGAPNNGTVGFADQILLPIFNPWIKE